MENLEIIESNQINNDELLDLYNSLGWTNYTNEQNKDKLQIAIKNSSYVVQCRKNGNLIGLARCISDDVSICYLQDILVRSDYQRIGIGRKLISKCLERYSHVRMKVLMTDDEKRQKLFYESLGYKNTKELNKIILNTYVRMDGMKLE